MYGSARKQNAINSEKYYIADGNVKRWAQFQEALNQWRNQAEFAQSALGKENHVQEPPRPLVPLEEYFDDFAFDQWWEIVEVTPTSEAVTPKFYIKTRPFDVPASAWVIGPTAPKPPVYDTKHPVGSRDTGMPKGYFRDQGGPTFKVGDIWENTDTEQKYKLVAVRNNPFDQEHDERRWALVGVAVGIEG